MLISDARICFFTVISFIDPPSIVAMLAMIITLMPLCNGRIRYLTPKAGIASVEAIGNYVLDNILNQSNTHHQARTWSRTLDIVARKRHEFEKRRLLIENQSDSISCWMAAMSEF